MGDLILLEQPSVIKDVSASTLLQLGVDSKCAVCVCAKDFTALEPTWARELKLQCVQVPVASCSADDVLPSIAKAVISEVKNHRRTAQGSSSSSSSSTSPTGPNDVVKTALLRRLVAIAPRKAAKSCSAS